MDFRERDSRSIWRSKLRLSCNRFLLAGAGLLFAGEAPLSFRFQNPAFAGASGLSKPENSEAPFRKSFRSCVRLTEATSE